MFFLKRALWLIVAMGILTVTLVACGGETEISFSYEKLAEAVKAAEAQAVCQINSKTEADIFYQPTSLKKYDVHAEQTADVVYQRGKDGGLIALTGEYVLESGNDTESYTVYYEDGVAYFEEEGRRYRAAIAEEAFAVQEMFLFFPKEDIKDLRAYSSGDTVRVTFRVPWESASPKANQLYDELAEILQSSGTNYSDVSYKDIQAEFYIAKDTNKLIEYTYEYVAQMEVDDVDVDVTGKSSCRIVATENIEVEAPQLSLWD